MRGVGQSQSRTENRILAALPENERSRLLSGATEVCLKRGTILYSAGEPVRFCYFPLGGMISVLSTTESGKSVAIGVTGNEGFISVAALLQPATAPYEVTVQIETSALKVKADVLRKEFLRGEKFQQLVMGYLHRILLQISQSAVCHHFHTVEQRLACWLLAASDCVHSDELSLRQEYMAQMLGVPRTNVSMTAKPLQEQGFISYHYGKIKILDHQKLERLACECYRTVKRKSNSSHL